jgi:hypothetical protein
MQPGLLVFFSEREAANLKVCRSLRDFPGQIEDLSGEPGLGENSLLFSKRKEFFPLA